MPAAVQTFDEAKNAMHSLFETIRARLPADKQSWLVEQPDVYGNKDEVTVEFRDPRKESPSVRVQVWVDSHRYSWNMNIPQWVAHKVQLPVSESSVEKDSGYWDFGVDALSTHELASLFINMCEEFAA